MGENSGLQSLVVRCGQTVSYHSNHKGCCWNCLVNSIYSKNTITTHCILATHQTLCYLLPVHPNSVIPTAIPWPYELLSDIILLNSIERASTDLNWNKHDNGNLIFKITNLNLEKFDNAKISHKIRSEFALNSLCLFFFPRHSLSDFYNSEFFANQIYSSLK